MRVVVVRHHEEDSAGFIGTAFEARGATLSTLLYPKEGALPDLAGVAHIVMLGSTSSVYDEGEAHAWIGEELTWLRRAAMSSSVGSSNEMPRAEENVTTSRLAATMSE